MFFSDQDKDQESQWEKFCGPPGPSTGCYPDTSPLQFSQLPGLHMTGYQNCKKLSASEPGNILSSVAVIVAGIPDYLGDMPCGAHHHQEPQHGR